MTKGRLKRFFTISIVMVFSWVLLTASSCDSNADKVNENLGKECEKFNCQRQIIVTNTITDTVLWQIEGKCSLEQNGALPRNLELICKQGPDEYFKHHVGLADNLTWVSQQMEPLDVSEYRTKIIFRPESIVPDLDLMTGDGS